MYENKLNSIYLPEMLKQVHVWLSKPIPGINQITMKIGYKSIQQPTNTYTRNPVRSWTKLCCGPQHPYQGYINAIELACQSLKTTEAEDLRAYIYGVLRHSHPPRPNLSKEEWKALKQLKTDKECIILTADKGVALVVMDRQEYTKRAKILLEDTDTCRPIPTDPTIKLKTTLINILRNIIAETGMSKITYNKMYPTGASAPKFYGLPKTHKKEVLLRSIVSSVGSITYGVAKELAGILKPLLVKASTMLC